MRRLVLFFSLAAQAADFGPRFAEIARDASPRELHALLHDLPKGADLHMHYGLSFWARDWYDVAQGKFYTRVRFGNCAPETQPLLYVNLSKSKYDALSECEKKDYVVIGPAVRDAWISSLMLDRPGEGRNEFFERIVPRLQELNRDPDTATEVFARSLTRWAAEGVRYVEMMVLPAASSDVEGYTKRLREVALASPIPVRYLGIFVRYLPDAEQRLAASYEFVHRNRDLWVGLNMAGREDNDKGTASRFREPFRQMRRKYSGIHLSLHGGEVDSTGNEVRQTLLNGAERIGHGFNVIDDPDTMLLLRNGPHLIETALVSNKLLEYFIDISDHPFIEFLRLGIPVCLNTDDQGSWDSNLTDEYFTAVKTFQLSWDEVMKLGRNSLQYSFAPDDLKRTLLNNYDIAVKAFEARYSSGDWRKKLADVKPVVSGYARRNFSLKPELR